MQASAEIRFRIDRDEREQFEQLARRIGMDMNEMVRVFIRRSLAEGGLPFEMRAPAAEPVADAQLLPVVQRMPSVHGVSVARLAQIASGAFAAADEEHVLAGRMPAASQQAERTVER